MARGHLHRDALLPLLLGSLPIHIRTFPQLRQEPYALWSQEKAGEKLKRAHFIAFSANTEVSGTWRARIVVNREPWRLLGANICYYLYLQDFSPFQTLGKPLQEGGFLRPFLFSEQSFECPAWWTASSTFGALGPLTLEGFPLPQCLL